MFQCGKEGVKILPIDLGNMGPGHEIDLTSGH